MRDQERLILKAKVKGLAVEGGFCRRQIRKTKRERRDQWWTMKRVVGDTARDHLLAYGLLRGLPYAAIERPRADNAPSAARVLQVVLGLMPPSYRGDWTLDRVRAWLATTVAAVVAPTTEAASP